MNDFDDLLKKAQSTERTNYINQSLFIELLSNDRKKLEALFYLLKHITNDGLYYYKSQSFNNKDNASKLYINELRKIKYTYLTIYRNYDVPDNILLTELLENFETFKRIIVNLDFVTIKYCFLSKSFKRFADLHDSDTYILNFNPITNTDKSFIEELIHGFTGLLFSSRNRKKHHGVILNKVIDDLNLMDLLQKGIFSVDKENIYYIETDNSNFLKTKNDKILSITYNIPANLYLEEVEIFDH
jgi:hypothetical protein